MWFQLPLPLTHQLLEHAIRSELQYFPADSKSRELIVSHAHVDFVSLHVVFCYRLQLSGGSGCEKIFQDW